MAPLGGNVAMVTEALVAGILAGLAVAMPLGAIGVLIIETGASAGFRAAWAAGMGTATADLGYGVAAAFAGAALAGPVEAARTPLAIGGGLVLAAIGVHGVARAWRGRPAAHGPAPAPRGGRTYLAFLALTAINPLTIVIFAAIVAGLPELAGAGDGARLAFVAGVFGASAAWQTLLAAGGTLIGRAAPTVRRWTSLAGHAIVLVLAARLVAAA